ncbi:hypothetical protein C8Q74DRAFT_214172 [Fomes fomentarius]|nr:hypothetical protein C8Q74DRAFT_214172 [Fomes fomentarius]
MHNWLGMRHDKGKTDENNASISRTLMHTYHQYFTIPFGFARRDSSEDYGAESQDPVVEEAARYAFNTPRSCMGWFPNIDFSGPAGSGIVQNGVAQTGSPSLVLADSGNPYPLEPRAFSFGAQQHWGPDRAFQHPLNDGARPSIAQTSTSFDWTSEYGQPPPAQTSDPFAAMDAMAAYMQPMTDVSSLASGSSVQPTHADVTSTALTQATPEMLQPVFSHLDGRATLEKDKAKPKGKATPKGKAKPRGKAKSKGDAQTTWKAKSKGGKVRPDHRKFPCTWTGCSETFTRKCNMTRHVKVIHEKIREFQCDKCKHAFGTENDLARHAGEASRFKGGVHVFSNSCPGEPKCGERNQTD